jgi:hypothetical protein
MVRDFLIVLGDYQSRKIAMAFPAAALHHSLAFNPQQEQEHGIEGFTD